MNDCLALDIHVHPGTKEDQFDCGGVYVESAMRYFHRELRAIPIEETADLYRKLRMKAVLLAWDAETGNGLPPLKNETVAGYVERFPDVFFGFGSVDPWKKDALPAARRAVKDLGLRGFKFHPAAQAFFPDDEAHFPLWEVIEELGVPALFHTGGTGWGVGPGGHGVELRYVRPIHLDRVAAKFPRLKIIAAHGGWPWTDELLAVAMHKTNVFIDLSGWSPKYLSPSLVTYANVFLKDRVLFGSDYPYLDPRRWLEDFAQAKFKDEVRPNILKTNALRLLGLAPDAATP